MLSGARLSVEPALMSLNRRIEMRGLDGIAQINGPERKRLQDERAATIAAATAKAKPASK